MPDVLTLLEHDHRDVEHLFAEIKSTSGTARARTFGKLAYELASHADVEERFVYPAMQEAGLQSDVDQAEEEHARVRRLVAELAAMDSASAGFDNRLAELEGDVSQHLHEEETEAFPRFRNATSAFGPRLVQCG